MGFLNFQIKYRRFKNVIYTWLLRRDFGAIGKGSLICHPFHSNDPSQIYIGQNVSIHAGGWLDCVEKYGNVQYCPKIEIGDGTYFGHRAHVIAAGPMKIGKNVLCADGVYISDNLHGYEDIKRPIFDQELLHPGPVTIEDEVWLGENVCVLPNVTIGTHSVIGANSVVTKDIPPYSIAVGTPAKVIKQYNSSTGKWHRV